MPDFKDRLTEEKGQLEDRISKLESFVKSIAFTQIQVEQRRLLTIQLHAMRTYDAVLFQRLALLTEGELQANG